MRPPSLRHRHLSTLAALTLTAACGGSSNTGYLPEGGLDGAAGGGTGGAAGAGTGGSGGSAGAAATGGSAGAAASGGAAGAGATGGGGAAGAGATGGGGAAGAGATGGGAGTGGSGGVTPCVNSLDCVGTSTPVCDQTSGVCVECTLPADCAGTAECVGTRCVPYVACVNSLGCVGTSTPVCDTAAGRCVECVTTADCSAGVCENRACVVRTACTSDTQCTPLGQLCDRTLGYCVDCTADVDCPATQHCSAGSCAADVCTAGSQACQGNALATCAANGSGWTSTLPCGTRQTCTGSAGSAACAPWVCTAGASECQGTSIVTCAADGLSVLSSTDCANTGLLCVGGVCSNQVCTPSARYCDGNSVRQCDSLGASSTLVQQCTLQQTCSAGQCQNPLCAPNQPYCVGNTVYQCNGTGSAGTPITDCTNLGQTCTAGACQSACTPSLRNLRLYEVFLGDTDYVMVENRGACAVNLQGAVLRTSWRYDGDASVTTLVTNLPAMSLAAGARLRISDDSTAAPPVFYAGANIGYNGSSVGAAELCEGGCGTLAATIDVVVFDTSATTDFTGLPVGASFVSPLTGIVVSNSNTHAYRRVAWAGASPVWRSGDWSTGPATFPLTTGCPASQPAAGSSCTDTSLSCAYGLTTCTCDGFFTYTWSCAP